MTPPLSHEECLAILFAEDPPLPKLASYPLWCEDGRRGFLETLSRMGEAGLFAAVSHVWTSLNPPRAVRCIMIGQRVGTYGHGKKAIWLALERFLDQDGDLVVPLPESSPLVSLDDLHRPACYQFDTEWRAHLALIARYAAVLTGLPCS